MKTVLVYRSDLLPPSETFIQAQAESLRRYKAHLIGLRPSKPSLLRDQSCSFARQHSRLPTRLSELTYDYVGLQPKLHHPKYFEALRELQPALMHAHFAPDAAIALPLATALQIPLIVTLHGYDVTASLHGRNPLRKRMQARQRQQLKKKASLFFCVSDFIRRKALAAGYPEAKLLVHRIGIDTAIFRSTAEPNRSQKILFVGRLTEKKGCEYLLRAMAAVQRALPSATLILIGEGPLRSSLQALAAYLSIECVFLGRQDHEAVRRHIASARVCVVPSITASNGDSEGLPMFLAEAQGLGTPVVATRHAGIPEGIVDGAAGLLSDERDIDGLAANILRVLTDDALHTDLSRRGVALVQREFNLQQQTQRLEDIYDAIIAGRAPHP